jgi:hypothetical protein
VALFVNRQAGQQGRAQFARPMAQREACQRVGFVLACARPGGVLQSVVALGFGAATYSGRRRERDERQDLVVTPRWRLRVVGQ